MFDSIHTLITNNGWSPAAFNALIFIGATVLIQLLYAWLSRNHDKKAADAPLPSLVSPTDFTRLIEQHAPGRFTRQQLQAIERSLQGLAHPSEGNLSIQQFDLGTVVISAHDQHANVVLPNHSHIVNNGKQLEIEDVKIELHANRDHTQLIINGQNIDLTPYTRNHH